MALDECGRPAPVSFEQVVIGEYLAMFAQPEGAATEAGQKVLRGLASGDQIRALFVDEVHQVSLCLKYFCFYIRVLSRASEATGSPLGLDF